MPKLNKTKNTGNKGTMKRRTFFGILLTVLGSTAFASFVYPLIRYFAPPARDNKSSTISIKKSDLLLGEAREIILNNKPVIVINRYQTGLVAFSRICTHLGCLVEYDKGLRKLTCPCHAGTFDLEGNVLSGPPPRPLSAIPLKIEGDIIVIG